MQIAGRWKPDQLEVGSQMRDVLFLFRISWPPWRFECCGLVGDSGTDVCTEPCSRKLDLRVLQKSFVRLPVRRRASTETFEVLGQF